MKIKKKKKSSSFYCCVWGWVTVRRPGQHAVQQGEGPVGEDAQLQVRRLLSGIHLNLIYKVFAQTTEFFNQKKGPISVRVEFIKCMYIYAHRNR